MTIEQWDSKDPDESDRFGIDWRPRLAGSTIASSTWVLVAAAGLTLSDGAHDDYFATMTLSGGTLGEVAVIQNSIVTADGRDLEETRSLPIVSSAGATASGYTVPGPAQFITRYPRFANASTDAIEDALNEAATRVDESWVEADFGRAIMLYAAHVLTLDGHGTGTEAQLAGLGDFQRIESGGLKLGRFDRFFTPGVMALTSFGKRFAELQRLNFAGPRAVPRIDCLPHHPGATD